MSLNNASIPLGGTYTPAGGVATSFISLGSTQDTNKLYLDDGADLLMRKTILATSKAPVPNASAPNGYTQQRSTIVGHIPLLLDNGKITKNSFKVEISFDPETNATERAELREMVAHLGVDADFDGLFDDGSAA